MGYQFMFDIAGVEYGMNDVQSARLTAPLFDKLSVGNVCSSELDITFWPIEDVPKMAKIIPYVKDESYSDWYELGEFWIDTRKKVGSALSVVAYDGMMRGEMVWEPDQYLEFPMPMSEAAEVLAELMGTHVVRSANLSSEYTIDYPANEQTVRQTLGYIAAAHASNWIINEFGALCLVPLFGEPSNVFDVGRQVSSVELYDEIGPITGVALIVDDENEYRSGNDSGYVMEVTCPYGTQKMANDILARISGNVYRGYRAQAAVLEPFAQLGDGIIVDGTESFLAYRRVNFGPGFMSEIAAPGESAIIHEYGYKAPAQQDTDRKLAKVYSTISKTSEEIRLEVVNEVDGMRSLIDQKMDSISLSVSSTTGADGEVYSSIVLKVGDDMYTGQILMDGNVDISGQLSADALYAAMGNIADLTVDKLSTSRRIKKYLAGDKSDDNYIIAEDQILAFNSGVYVGGTEQARTPNGTPVFWESNPDDGVLGTDGYPYLNGVRIFTTTAETPWPVKTYKYVEHSRMKMEFEERNGIYAPVLTLGADNGYGNNQGFLYKSSDALNLVYATKDNKEIGVKMGYDGYTDIIGLRKTTKLDFSGWDSGHFLEYVDGDNSAHLYGVYFDVSGRPIKITDGEWHSMSITW